MTMLAPRDSLPALTAKSWTLARTTPSGTTPSGTASTAALDADPAIQAWPQMGDESAARWLVETHRPIVLKTISGWLPRDHMIQDVVQEVSANVFRAMPRVKVSRRFEGWLCTFARNTCAKALRSWRHRRFFNVNDLGIEDFDTITTSVNDDESNDHQLYHDLLQCLLLKLPDQDRRVTWLYFAEGLTAHEVGQREGLAPGTVRVRVCHSQRCLRNQARKLVERHRS
jgi:RNA polymerase sigma factor (sigma-70 family)